MKTLHYIMDPQCGWCYAATPLIDALSALSTITLNVHSGGLFSGANKRPLSSSFHQQIIAMDKRITELTGQIFSATYYAQVLEEEQRIVDSDTPITGILAASSLGIDPLTMLHTMQTKQFVDGLSQSNIENLKGIAEQLGANVNQFLEAFTEFDGAKTRKHIEQAQHILHLAGGNGFPTLAVEHADGTFTKLAHTNYYGQPNKWLAYVENVIKTAN